MQLRRIDKAVGRAMMAAFDNKKRMTPVAFEFLEYGVSEHIATVTFNRPDRLNALNVGLRDEIHAACRRIFEDDDVRVAIITGNGRGFCAGADLTGPRSEGDATPP